MDNDTSGRAAIAGYATTALTAIQIGDVASFQAAQEALLNIAVSPKFSTPVRTLAQTTTNNMAAGMIDAALTSLENTLAGLGGAITALKTATDAAKQAAGNLPIAAAAAKADQALQTFNTVKNQVTALTKDGQQLAKGNAGNLSQNLQTMVTDFKSLIGAL